MPLFYLIFFISSGGVLLGRRICSIDFKLYISKACSGNWWNIFQLFIFFPLLIGNNYTDVELVCLAAEKEYNLRRFLDSWADLRDRKIVNIDFSGGVIPWVVRTVNYRSCQDVHSFACRHCPGLRLCQIWIIHNTSDRTTETWWDRNVRRFVVVRKE